MLKMKQLKRLLSLILVFVMVIGAIQISSFAAPPLVDNMGGTDPNTSPTTPGGPDGIPDIYQVVFEFKTECPDISELQVNNTGFIADGNPNNNNNDLKIGNSIYIVKTRLDLQGNPTADTSVAVPLREPDIPFLACLSGANKIFVWWEDTAGDPVPSKKMGMYELADFVGDYTTDTVFTAHFEDDLLGGGPMQDPNYPDGIADIFQVVFEFKFDLTPGGPTRLHGYNFGGGPNQAPYYIVKTRYTDATKTQYSTTADVSLNEIDILDIKIAVVPWASCVFDYWEMTAPSVSEEHTFTDLERKAPATERTAYGTYNGSLVSFYTFTAHGAADRLGIGGGNPPLIDLDGNWHNVNRPDGIADKYQILFTFNVDTGGKLIPDSDTAFISAPLVWVGTKRDADGKLVTDKSQCDTIVVNMPTNIVPVAEPIAADQIVFWSDDTKGINLTAGATAPSGDYLGKWDASLGYYVQDFTAHFAEDKYGNPEDTDNPIPVPDGIPDKFQAAFHFSAGNHGTISLGTLTNLNNITVYSTRLDSNGGYAANGTATLAANRVPATNPDSNYKFSNWTDASGNAVTLANKSITADSIFRANFTAISGVGTGGGTGGGTGDPVTPPVDNVPELETKNHAPYIFGYEDGMIRPNGNITRAEVSSIFFRLLTEESRQAYFTSVNNFSDVNGGEWYNDAISTMANAGIVQGYPDGTFHPNATVTRAELATMAARFYQLSSGTLNFTDVPVGHWAYQYISSAVTKGWVAGYPDGTFKPDSSITRAETITLINRVIGRDTLGSTGTDVNTWLDNTDDAWYYEAIQAAGNRRD